MGNPVPSFSPLVLEVFGAMEIAWPEVVLPGNFAVGAPAPNVWTSIQAFRKNFEAEAANAEQGLPGAVPPPYHILSVGESSDDAEFGMVIQYKRRPIRIFKLDSFANGATQDSIDFDLIRLLTLIDGADYAIPAKPWVNFQVAEFGKTNSSESNPWNANVLGVNKGEMIGGHIEWLPGWRTVV